MATQADYIIVGGGLAGCVVAARLAENDPDICVLVIEAGADVSNHPLTAEPTACFAAHHSELDWDYTTTPQSHLGDRRCYNSAGKALSGSSAVNYGGWTRGAREDYDAWARIVRDDRWGYDGLLPYFKKTEQHQGSASDTSQHGDHGPITNISVTQSSEKRLYPLRETLSKAWEEVGVSRIEDGNAGNPFGLAETRENFKNGQRQLTSDAYGLRHLENVKIITKTLVRRVLIDQKAQIKKAIGVELADGSQIRATREVVVSCGAYRTPQLLLMSGIGPREELSKHGINQHAELPVGKNFHDHLALHMFWKLKYPEMGLALGTPLWADPAYRLGLPNDFLATTSVSSDLLQAALEKDGHPTDHDMIRHGRGHLETLVAYAPAGAQIQGTPVPIDGSIITTAVLGK